MQIYLPIAEMSVDIFLILALGGGVGFLSGMFGVGGGFLITPLLIFIGVPPLVAVATGSNQVLASSVSGALAHWRRRTIDVKMGVVLLAGGIVGAIAGVQLATILKRLGQVDLLISLSYVIFLGVIGALMLVESVRAIRRAQGMRGPVKGSRHHSWVQGLPLRMKFHRSKLYISAIPPIGVGFVVGMLAAIMGVGGGFIMVPAMIYLLGMPTSIVIGTSLFQIIFVTAATTYLHSVENQSVDAVLALILLAGGVIGAQFGTKAGARLKGEHLRLLLALLVLLVGARLAVDLIVPPQDAFSLWVPR